ncbi:hypothetical protein StoSoilA2_21490 [Arthrobacter sp. StoSoilA2]|nr:hypothetical protein StoSoilA2_21490 [Arthrobacter sp. StoSoilA2]
MGLGGVRLDVLEQLFVIRAGELDPLVRGIYTVESAHCSSLERLRLYRTFELWTLRAVATRSAGSIFWRFVIAARVGSRADRATRAIATCDGSEGVTHYLKPVTVLDQAPHGHLGKDGA